MSEIIKLVDNIINKEDRARLESFGGHTIAHGRATRWHWAHDKRHDAVFEIFYGGDDEQLAAQVVRDRRHDVFIASDAKGKILGSGSLEHIMALLDEHFIAIHGE